MLVCSLPPILTRAEETLWTTALMVAATCLNSEDS